MSFSEAPDMRRSNSTEGVTGIWPPTLPKRRSKLSYKSKLSKSSFESPNEYILIGFIYKNDSLFYPLRFYLPGQIGGDDN